MNKAFTRRKFLTTSSCALGAAALGESVYQDAAAQPAEITRVDLNHAWVFQGGGCNVFAIPGMTEDGVLMVDGGLADHTGAILDAVYDTFGQERVHTLVNTHWHPEQTGANERLGAEGTVIIAHEKTRMFLENAVMSALYEGRYGPLADAGLPVTTLSGTGTFKFAGQEIIYGYLPAAHSESDLFLYFPILDILIAGGPVTTDQWPILDIRHGAWTGGLVSAYEMLGQIVSADTTVIPAHGPIISGTDLLRMRAMYTNFHLDLAEQLNLGMGPKDTVNMGLLDDYVDQYGDPTQFIDYATRSMQRAFVPD